MKKLSRKLQSDRGFSLVETLLAVMIVGLMCIIVGGGTVVVKDAFERMIKKENAVTLCSTIDTKLESELRSAEYKDTLGDGTIIFVSHSAAAYKGMVVGIVQDPADNLIKLHFYTKEGDDWKDMDNSAPILPASTFTDDLVPVLDLQYAGGSFTYKVEIKGDTGDGVKVLAETGDRNITPKY